jgi:hypothetical protein
MSRLNEGADDYPRIVRRTYPGGAETYPGANWKGRSYCRTSEALRRCSREHAGPVDPSAVTILAALPAWINSAAAMIGAP